jgi:hypothetical protein
MRISNMWGRFLTLNVWFSGCSYRHKFFLSSEKPCLATGQHHQGYAPATKPWHAGFPHYGNHAQMCFTFCHVVKLYVYLWSVSAKACLLLQQPGFHLLPTKQQFGTLMQSIFGNAHRIEKIPALWAGTSPLRRCAPAHRAGTRPASRLTCSPSWYQPSDQVNLLTQPVTAQQAS